MQWQAIIVLVVLFTALGVLASDKFAVHGVMLTTLVIVWSCGIIDEKLAMSGFSNNGVQVIACLLVFAKVLSDSALVHRFCLMVLGKTSTPRVALLRMQVMVMGLSAFLNNTPL